MVGLLNPIKYGENFYDLYTLNTRRKLQNDRKPLGKRKNKDKKSPMAILEVNPDLRILNQLDQPLLKEQLLLCPAFPVAHIELQPNASQFAVFSAIRSTVLEAETRRLLFYELSGNARHLPNLNSSYCLLCGSCLLSNQSAECSCQALQAGGGANGAVVAQVAVAGVAGAGGKRSRQDSANSDVESESEECLDKEPKIVTVPLIVGAGLRSLFELISEARHIQPTFCSKALKALLDVIQGQQPESFKHEPEELINPLYDLLLDLATMSTTENGGSEADWSAVACSALIGLCIARGDTGKMLKAIAALIMSPRHLSLQRIQMPAVLGMLQRTVISAALAKPTCPDFYTKGVPLNSIINEFTIKAPFGGFTEPSLASDGTYLYLLLGGALLKIGTGYNGSYKGHIYMQNDEFTKEKTGWLGYSNGQLYYRRNSKRNADHLHLVNTELLTIKSMNPVNMLPIREGFNYTLFTDEDSLNAICTNRDDSLVVRRLNIGHQNRTADRDNSLPVELPLQLSRKRFRTLGYATFEEEVLNQNQILKIQASYNIFEPKIPNDVDLQEIVCGKEFGLVCANNGKVYYYGKSSALGLKSVGRTPIMKLTELIISKISRIIHIAVGHDGIHALLVNDDGTVYFAGTARRGEDGDISKNRRQPKAVKPKKMTKIEGHVIVQAACNNGTSAFVTKTGKLIMFGKDTVHCDAQGFVTDFADQHIQKVALGKAHCVALNAKGQVFTFGLNNKGQCGHVYNKSKESSTTGSGGSTVDGSGGVSLASGAAKSQNMKKLKFDFSNLCDYDDHTVVQGQCRVCVVCKECTGFSISCVSSLNIPLEERVGGATCACGHGDAGCSKCGLCASCIAVQESESVSDTKDTSKQLNRQRSKSLIMRRKDKKSMDDTSSHTEENPPRVAPLAPQLLQMPSTSPVVQVSCGLHHTVVLTLSGEVYAFGSNQFGQLGTGDMQPATGPVRINVPGNVCQVAAGSNHTVLLTYKGLVYTFGNFQKGQLGRLPHDFQQKAGASRDSDKSNIGQNYRESFVNQDSLPEKPTVAQMISQRQKILWHCTPGVVFGIGPSFGKKATWIGASGDQTFIKLDESLITTQMLPKMNVAANKKTILMIPTIPLTFSAISINRRDGNCTAHYHNQVDFAKMEHSNKPKLVPEVNQNVDQNTMVPLGPTSSSGNPINEQMSRSMHEARNQMFDLQDNNHVHNASGSQRKERNREYAKGCLKSPSSPKAASSSAATINDKSYSKLAFAMDPMYDILWVYDCNQKKVLSYNVLASEIQQTGMNSSNYRALLTPELSMPNKFDSKISRLHASLNLLACLDVLTSAQDVIPACFEDISPKEDNQSKELKDNQYQVCNRFDNFGGGWGYSGHSVEAIRFSADTDVMIYGFGMFGGRGEYSCKLKLYDMGCDGGGYEKEGTLISETKEIPFECPARSKYHILLPKPVSITAGRWYLVWARIAGPSSDCGSCGQATVTTEDQVVFTFKSSKKANNGTDVNSGQIPAILYRLITQESKQPPAPVDIDPVKRVTKEFANSVTKECFESLVLMLNWSWEAFKGYLREQRDMSHQLQVKQSLEYLIHVNKSCLRLLRKYTNEIYPQYGTSDEIAEYISTASGHKSLNNRSDKEVTKFTKPSSTLLTKYFNDNGSGSGGVGGGGNQSPMKKSNMENLQLAECIGNVRAMLIGIFCDDIFQDISSDEALSMALEILDECHISFVACFGVFYPTSTLKWNCLCDLLSEMDKQGTLHSRLLSAILAGLCSPTVKLRSTFALLNHGNERHSIVSPSDNSGLPMLSSTDSHQYPILVEQMIYRTQQEKCDFLSNSWTFKDVLMRLLDIIANPIRDRLENIYNRGVHYTYSSSSYCSKDFNQGLIDNCCHLLARVLAEIVYQTAIGDYDKMFVPPRTLHSSGSRFARCDQSRTWNTGSFGPDAIAFSVDRSGIAIAGCMVYTGSGSYEYQLELLCDTSGDVGQQQPLQQQQHKWETLESVSGTYDQSVVQNDMAEVKFERSVLIKENTRYALRFCSQGHRTCSGDGGLPSVRGPCGTTFQFYACDLSFNGTNAHRGQIPCILYYSTPIKSESNGCSGGAFGSGGTGGSGSNDVSLSNETTMRDTALQIASDITKKCTELLVLARNTLAASLSPSDNSSNHSQTIDSEHNITPIEEHMDINWANNSRTSHLPAEAGGLSAARDLSKRLESFSKGIIETLKFEKRSTNPFEMEIEIGATEIHPKDLMIEETAAIHDLNFRNGQITKFNGNERVGAEAVENLMGVSGQFNPVAMARADSEETPGHMAASNILDVFNLGSSNLFHTLLPLVYAHIANLACNDAKSSVQILGLIKEILPHIAALNQLSSSSKETTGIQPNHSSLPRLRPSFELFHKKFDTGNEACSNALVTASTSNQANHDNSPTNDTPTTSNHYCVVESEHPYRSASINCYRVEFPPCVQWLTIEFDPQCGTAQMEDYLLVSVPMRPLVLADMCHASEDYYDILDNNIKSNRSGNNGGHCKNATLLTSCYKTPLQKAESVEMKNESDWFVVKKFNSSSNWLQNVMILPGNCVEFSLETSSLYVQDPRVNRYGFKCLVVGYDNPVLLSNNSSCLVRIEQELSYLGGMCSGNLMKKNLSLPDDKDVEDLSTISETISTHFALLSKGLALAEPDLTIHQALESYLPIGSQSNERQFLKDFISGAPGSSGARLAAWLQPEPRLDPNKCELNTITEPLRYGWPTPITVTIRDQYGDAIVVPELKVEIKAIPTGSMGNGNVKLRRASQSDTYFGGVAPPPRQNYEPTIKEKMCFKAITFMKPYNNYSFEELRYNSPIQTRVTETLFAQDMEDGTFSVHWTPNAVGSYCLTVNIDGILLEEVYRVEVKEGSVPPPAHKRVMKNHHTPNKLRKFYTENTAGLRIRSHPTLQSEQVGVIKLNGVISFIDEIENDDGVWLRLSTESIRQHCAMGWYPTEAWCLQYNQHLGKTLLHPVVENATSTTRESNTNDMSMESQPMSPLPAVPDVARNRQRDILDNLEPVNATLESPSPNSKSAEAKKVFDFATNTPKAVEFPHVSTNPFICADTESKNSANDQHQFVGVVGDGEKDDPFAAGNSGATNPIGSAIAGVVGGGAIKLQALQKWFKGDNEPNSGRDYSFKPSDVGEIASVSVRELVRVMGGQDSRSNGNGSQRSCSPIKQATEEGGRLAENMDNTLAQDTSNMDVGNFDVANMRKTHFTPSQTAALLSTPKHSPRRVGGSRKSATSLGASSLASETGGLKESDISNLEDEMSLMQITTSSTSSGGTVVVQDQIVFGDARSAQQSTASTENSSPPIWPESATQNAFFKSMPQAAAKKTTMGPIKRAMPPSFAESIRAVFAAFLWHEGIVHDAMACASFLKFHPNLPKEGTTVVTRRDHGEGRQHLSKEQKAQQRHSVEVANAGNYLNIRPSTLETLTKTGNFSVNNRKYRKGLSNDSGEAGDVGEKQKLHSLPEVVTVLPPALRSLVYLWEHICSNCVHIVQSNSLSQEKFSNREGNGESKEKQTPKDKEREKKSKKKKDDGSWCEICQVFLPIPVTYHMRIVHPGCGKSAKGKGYNSVGIFCEGWAGNCGEGGKGASSWFLMCDACRDKYISTNKNTNNLNNTNAGGQCSELNLFGIKTTTLIANSDIYNTMRENATFLLELSSNITNLPTDSSNAATSGLGISKRSPQQMPVVVEHQHFNISEMNKPSTSRGDAAQQQRHSRVGLRITNKFGGNVLLRKSFTGGSCSPEHPWLAPETFACLETFGSANKDDLPYEIFGMGPNDGGGFDRPLSEISYESDLPNFDQPNPPSCMTSSTGTLSKFHRSYSMGQGWGAVQQQSGGGGGNVREEPYYPKVVFRKRNSTIDSDGSLLICYPSENLRRLVPDHVLTATSVVLKTSSNLPEAGGGDPLANDSSKDCKFDFEISKQQNQRNNCDNESMNQVNALLQRPAMAFMTQKHDLKKLRSAMKRSLRIATCRNYSLQALNWLLRSVTQSVCLHDLMWWFVSSLSITGSASSDPMDGKFDELEPALEHPVSYTQISGRLSHMITESLHTFLQSVADLTLHLPLGSPLQRIAIQCFGIRFRQTDHQFLHSSHVFGNISKILSKSDEQNESPGVFGMSEDAESKELLGKDIYSIPDAGGKIIYYSDLNGHFDITVSSRQAMAESLTDNSTETFWESDEEDRNKSKIVEISMNKLTYCCKMLLIHIDNSRDIQNKVSSVAFYGGQSLGDTSLIKNVEVDAKACTWISTKINDDNFTHFRLEFTGPENTLRVRQIKILGLPAAMCGSADQLTNPYDLAVNNTSQGQAFKYNMKLTNAVRIQQQICEAETLRVFRLITGQVFGKLISLEPTSDENGGVLGKSHSQNALGMDTSANSILADSLDLREHMVGILFSRSKLSHLQKQVIVHIVHAIKKEARRAREDWDAVNLANSLRDPNGTGSNGQESKGDSNSERGGRTADTYCFEMLSMVLALSGSVVGRSYLSHQHGLIKDLLSLLHTGSDRVQRQVTALLRRILPEISPATFADILGVQRLPPSDYNIAHQIAIDFDMDSLGLLDIFLAVIAKSLQLQVKVKSAGGKSNMEKTPAFVRLYNSLDLSVHLLKPVKMHMSAENINVEVEDTFSRPEYSFEYERSMEMKGVRGHNRELKREAPKNLNQRWFLNGVIPTKQAESIIALIRDLATGKLGEKWSQMTKAAIAEAVLNLTRLDEIFRSPENCVKTATLWLALASLCVLDNDHVEKLSSGQWTISDTRPMCSNHDDGETSAIIQCENCGSLCGDCDRFLHLNRKTRTHKRTVCKEEEEAIRVELHESCGRTKLFWLLALADSKTLKAMVEFRDGSHTIISGAQDSVGRCRFCGITGNSGLLEIGNVCADAQCQEYASNSCMKTKPCGHVCGGVVNEKKCLPCLQHVCHARENNMADGLNEPKLTQDADDMCMICFVEALACAPSIQLECGHVFHYHCCKAVLEKRWSGPRITFGFSLCPICKADIKHPMLAEILEPINALKQDVKRKAQMRIKYEGIVKDTENRDLTNLAMERYAYYVCFKCQKAYYGGEARCDVEIGEKFNPEELVCGGCSDVARAQMCPKHGTDFLEYKCRYCCSVAVFFCFGTTHFCDTCHDDFQRLTNIPKNKLPQCPAGPKAKQLMGEECPLHVIHPPTGEEFALGCGVCRNAQTF
ncbi:E3 ubiquitin-protein ligase highwire [Musca domestica]|uniref:RCR-type E3 ubiquitin transferase n=2 Tax=Musca domestica TaxID=7370 RepID=A0A1I8MRE8_MUSDO|nr:E3 ubiquitin-protein ligase highwire [Musca domestica]